MIDGDITVTGWNPYGWGGGNYDGGGYGGGYNYNPPDPYAGIDGGGGGGGDVTPIDPLHCYVAGHKVDINFTRPLTVDEQRNIEDFKKGIEDLNSKIHSLSPDQHFTLPNGSTVSTNELISLWNKTSFEINDVGKTYPSPPGTLPQDRGGTWVDPASGSIHNAFNIDLLAAYDPSGMINNRGVNYLLLHELGHETSAGVAASTAWKNTGSAADQQHAELIANDIAKGAATIMSVEVLTSPTWGYDDYTPTLQAGAQ